MSKIITIDGPAGSGKSSIAKKLSQELGFYQVDSGALYRVATLLAIRFASKKTINIEEAVLCPEFEDHIKKAPIKILFQDHRQKIFLDEEYLNQEIRKAEITRNVNLAADTLFIRKWVSEKLHEIVKEKNILVDGRDMGTEVFPDAPFKFYITASIDERVKRRLKQLKNSEVEESELNYEVLKNEISKRDHEDKKREIGLLKPAKGAVLIDTTEIKLEEAVQKIKEHLDPLLNEPDGHKPEVSDAGKKNDGEDNLEDDDSMENTFIPEEHLAVFDLRKGSHVSGKILRGEPSTKPDYYLVNLNSKSEGIIAADEFKEIQNEGDTVEAIVSKTDPDTGLVHLSKRLWEQEKSMSILQEVFKNDLPITAVIKKRLSKGYLMDVENIEMFMPLSHTGDLFELNGEDVNHDQIGETLSCKILELNEKTKNGIVSRKALLDQQNKEYWKKLSEKISIGDIIKAKVEHHINAGIFLELDHVAGFLKRSDISWSRKNFNLKEKFPEGTVLDVKVLDFDPENLKLVFGLKQLIEDPWENITEKIMVGSTVEGCVSYVAQYGAFVDISRDIEGFLPLGDISWDKKINNAKNILKEGDPIKMKILTINIKNKRITLGLKQLQKNPWEYIEEHVREGDIQTGKIKNILENLMFVEVSPFVDALIRQEDISWNDQKIDMKNTYKENQEIKFQVKTIDKKDHRISGSIKHLEPSPYEVVKKKYPNKSLVEGRIVKIINSGLIVEIPENLCGFVHISEITRDKSRDLVQNFKQGDHMKFMVKNVDPKNEKIALSLKTVGDTLQRSELRKYVEKEYENKPLTNSPFSGLKKLVSE